MTAKEFNDWRVFPRLGMVFMSGMFVWFHLWFTGYGETSVINMSEWHIVGYGTVVAGYIGLWKFYFETGPFKGSAHD